MTNSKNISFTGLLLLCGCVAVGLVLTRDQGGNVGEHRLSTAPSAQHSPTVNQRPLATARLLSRLATTPEEQTWAREALRVADHAVDLAFSTALREATQHPYPPDPRVRGLEQAVKRASASVAADQAHIRVLTGALPSENVEDDQVELAQAQLALDQNELEDLKEDLSRAGGDAASEIQRMLDEHEAMQHATQAAISQVSTDGYNLDSLLATLRNWAALRAEINQLQQARQEATQAMSSLAGSHEALEKQVSRERAERAAVQQQPPNLLKGDPAVSIVSRGSTSMAVSALKRLSADEKTLTEYDRRIQDEQELADVYSKWMGLTKTQLRSAVHECLQYVLWIVIILLLVVAVDWMIDRLFSELSLDYKRLLSLRMVLRFAVRATGTVLVLFALFGRPTQLTTILGLAGAGLTVALKDFIVGFFGWFVLMGRNGLRVRDWVEINGVVGEVLEIGLLRTVLLESGNWTRSGHPTGRKVAFVNSFAIEGHFFNFSTSGQWLWDELQVTIGADQDPYVVKEKIKQIVARATEANGILADQEWQRVTQRYGMHAFSVEPAIDLRPVSGGVEVAVRYLTRAPERYRLKAHLYQQLVALLHRNSGAQQPSSEKNMAAAGGEV
jgi:small-conductance mechanosensitive channel